MLLFLKSIQINLSTGQTRHMLGNKKVDLDKEDPEHQTFFHDNVDDDQFKW